MPGRVVEVDHTLHETFTLYNSLFLHLGQRQKPRLAMEPQPESWRRLSLKPCSVHHSQDPLGGLSLPAPTHSEACCGHPIPGSEH